MGDLYGALAEGENTPTLADMLGRPRWQEDAACRHPNLTSTFFPENERSPEGRRAIERARAICATCPVYDACYDYAISRPSEHGIWAGTTERDRVAIRREKRANAA